MAATTTTCERCGRELSIGMAMAASFGTACPDCYDAMSDEAPVRTILADPMREVDLAADGTMTVGLRYEDAAAREAVKRAGLRWNPDLRVWRGRFADRLAALATAARLIALGVPAAPALADEVAAEAGRLVRFRVASKWDGGPWQEYEAFELAVPVGAPTGREFAAEVRAAMEQIRRAVYDTATTSEWAGRYRSIERFDPANDLAVAGDRASGTVRFRDDAGQKTHRSFVVSRA